MGELILHIGTRKTGTTSLQKFFSDNRDALAGNGVDYVQFTPQLDGTTGTYLNGDFLKKYCLAMASQGEVSSLVTDFEDNYRHLTDALQGNKRVLLSDEGFAAVKHSFNHREIWFEEFWRELAHIIKELGPSKTTFIIYLRRQDEYIISSWKERIKGGYTDKTIREYLCRQNTNYEMDYKTRLDAIRESFGSSAKIIVRSFNQIPSSSDGIYRDFCETLEIPWCDDYKLPETRLNSSLSFDMTEALRTSKCVMDGDGGRIRRRLARQLSKRHPDPKGTTILTAREAAPLMEQYRAGNHSIEEKYFDNKILFSDEFQEGPLWHPNKLRIAWCRLALHCPQLFLKIHSGCERMKSFLSKCGGSVYYNSKKW